MGAPKIDGGMTKKEQEELLEDERRYQDENETKRRVLAKADEKEREAAAKTERDRIKAEELARVSEANMAEEEIIQESLAIDEKGEGDKIKLYFKLVGKDHIEPTRGWEK